MREFENEGREIGGPVNGNDPGVATNVTELVVMGSRKDLASKAAHKPYTCMMKIMDGPMVIGARRRADGVVV
jgi:hypothetical protein